MTTFCVPCGRNVGPEHRHSWDGPNKPLTRFERAAQRVQKHMEIRCDVTDPCVDCEEKLDDLDALCAAVRQEVDDAVFGYYSDDDDDTWTAFARIVGLTAFVGVLLFVILYRMAS